MAKLAALAAALPAFYFRAQLEVLVVLGVNTGFALLAGLVAGLWTSIASPWNYVLAVTVGVFAFTFALALVPYLWGRIRGRPLGRGEVSPDLYALYDGFSREAYEHASALLRTAMHEMRDRPHLAERDLAASFQCVSDDGARAYSLAGNAILHRDGTNPDVAMGDFHRRYQGMVTWIEKGFAHGALVPTTIGYAAWLRADARFIDRLRKIAAQPDRKALQDGVRAAGWGEETRAKLPAAATGDGS